MIRWTACLLPVWLCVTVAWAADNTDPGVSDPVGRRGDPAKFSYQGATTFTPAQLSRALKYDSDFLSATREKHPIPALLEMTEQRLREGYRDYGFADVKVAAIVSAGGVVQVKIDEGPRYRCGGIEIKAPEGFPSEALKQWLQERHPPEDGYSRQIETPAGPRTQWFASNGEPVEPRKPLWKPGEDASSSAVQLATLENYVGRGLRSLGYRRSKPHVRVEPVVGDAKHIATLLVDLAEVGPRTTVRAIEINGLQRNSTAEVLKYLGVPEGAVFDTALQYEITQKLRASGRFRSYNVDTSSTSQDGAETLLVDVEEYEPVPPLGEELRPEQEVMLRFAEWVTIFPARDCDAVVSAKYQDIRCSAVVSPQRGMWARVKVATKPGEPEFWYEYFANEHQNTHALPSSRIKAVVPLLKSRLGLTVNVVSNPDRDDQEEQPFRILLGMEGHWGSSYAHLPSPLYCACQIEPCAAIDLVSGSDREFELNDEFLEIRGEGDARFKIGVSDGRLIEAYLAGDDWHVRLSLENGTFQNREDSFPKRTAGFEDWSDSSHGADVVARFVAKSCEGLEKSDVRFRFARGIVERMVNAHAFDGVDQCYRELWNGSDFIIPHTAGMQRQNARQKQFELLRMTTWLWLVANDKFVPPGHWSRRFVRELHLAFSGHLHTVNPELQELARSHEVGPVHRLLMCNLAEVVPTQAGAWFAGWSKVGDDGADRVTMREFQEDILLYCDGRYLPGQFVRVAAAELREASNADIKALLATITSKEIRKQIAPGIKLLRASREEPLDQALPKALEKWWEEGLHDLIEEQLDSLFKTLKRRGKPESA